MVRQEENDSGRYAFLKNCSIEELEALLGSAMKDEPKDEEYLSALESAILRREQVSPSGRLADVEKAWEQFRGAYLTADADRYSLSEELERQRDGHAAIAGSGGRTKPRRIGRIMLIAAVIVILVTLLLPPVLGYRNIFHMIGQWTSSAFQFDEVPQNTGEHTESPKGSRLETSLAACDVSIELVPVWFPDGMQLQDEHYSQQESGNIYYKAVFADETQGREIFFDLVQYTAPNSFVWEKDTGDVIEFPCGGVMHYITTNNGQVSLHWNVDLTEVTIYGDMSVEDAKAMIQSIYER